MTKEEYQDTQQRLMLIRQLCEGMPLSELLRAIERADVMGPVLGPTLWMRGRGELEKVRELAKALQVFMALPPPAYVEARDRP